MRRAWKIAAWTFVLVVFWIFILEPRLHREGQSLTQLPHILWLWLTHI